MDEPWRRGCVGIWRRVRAKEKVLPDTHVPGAGVMLFPSRSPCFQHLPLRTPSGCLLLYCSLAWSFSGLCQQQLLHVCCVCLSFWNEVCFSSSDRLARQTRLPFLFCFVFMSTAIFSPLKTILRLGMPCVEAHIQLLLWLREQSEGSGWETD